MTSVSSGFHSSIFLRAPLTTTYAVFLKRNVREYSKITSRCVVFVYLWVRLNFNVIITQMTLHSKIDNWCTVILANRFFLCVISNTYLYARVNNSTTCIQVFFKGTLSHMIIATKAPNVVRQLKSIELSLRECRLFCFQPTVYLTMRIP